MAANLDTLLGTSDEPPYVLIVDDDEAVCEVLATYLRPKGYRIKVVHTGRGAIEALKAKPPEVTILDLRLQDISGQEVQKYIHSHHLDTEVIVITGFASLDTALDAIKLGAFDYIVKPFKLGEIEISVRNALERLLLGKQNRALLDKVRELTLRLEKSAPTPPGPTIRFDEMGTSSSIRAVAPRSPAGFGGYAEVADLKIRRGP
ncbi:MAG TPA: response regulator [Candidatus Deferrimicrobiaceae bacterium]|jgi:DNA-binding NtrC family response regulator